MLELIEFEKHFPELPFTLRINAAIPDGGITFVTGASGAGKSTLLETIAGHSRSDRGQLRVDGKPLHHLAPGRRSCCLQLQSGSLFPRLPAVDNVALGLQGKLNRQTRQTAAVMLEKLGLRERAQCRITTLSSGERARVNLAQTLLRARSNRLVLLDEPVSAIATPQRPQLWQLIVSCLQPPVAYLIISTHLLPESPILAGVRHIRYLHLENGHGRLSGKPAAGFG